MIIWLLKNYMSLRKFMNIRINPFSMIAWEVSYKKPYNSLSSKQKQLSDEFMDRVEKMDSR